MLAIQITNREQMLSMCEKLLKYQWEGPSHGKWETYLNRYFIKEEFKWPINMKHE